MKFICYKIGLTVHMCVMDAFKISVEDTVIMRVLIGRSEWRLFDFLIIALTEPFLWRTINTVFRYMR